ncbi:LysR substrate-binding domain-containing protein [Streptomyces sp. NPDC021020]|uniref:LysR substrate-binding domain-containing protein n=1 Tax=Streptomyces sp. NPDC021020 TaxID=3365109 RepID=UPI0037BB9E0B
MELRDIEIFLTLAEELHFGRTAERLHITPSRVSHAIKKQERRIGAPLFARTSRTVRLTPAGERLAAALGPAYRQILDGIEEVTASVGETAGTLRLGTMGPQDWMIRAIVARFRAGHPAARFVHHDVNPVDPLAGLRAGEIDVAHVWLPVDEPGVTTGPVTHTSPIAVVLSAGHPYATRGSLCLEDYGDLTFISHRSPIPSAMAEVFLPSRTPAGRPVPRGPEVTGWEDLLKTVSSGRAVAATSAEAGRFYPWPSLVYLPVRDAAPCRWVFAWLTDNPNPLIPALVAAAAEGTPAPG